MHTFWLSFIVHCFSVQKDRQDLSIIYNVCSELSSDSLFLEFLHVEDGLKEFYLKDLTIRPEIKHAKYKTGFCNERS